MNWSQIADLLAYVVAGSSLLAAVLPRPNGGALAKARTAVDVLALGVGQAKPDGVSVIDRQAKRRSKVAPGQD